MRVGFALGLGMLGVVAAGPPVPADGAPADTSRYSWAIGATVGIPQTIGVTAEGVITPWLRFQGHAGTILVVTSVGGRLILLPSDRWVLQPYLFGGVGSFFSIGIEDFEGVIPYAWTGVGIRISIDRFILYGELSAIGESEDEFGGPLPAVGIQFQFLR